MCYSPWSATYQSVVGNGVGCWWLVAEAETTAGDLLQLQTIPQVDSKQYFYLSFSLAYEQNENLASFVYFVFRYRGGVDFITCFQVVLIISSSGFCKDDLAYAIFCCSLFYCVSRYWAQAGCRRKPV